VTPKENQQGKNMDNNSKSMFALLVKSYKEGKLGGDNSYIEMILY
jgi:hypothetical protein